MEKKDIEKRYKQLISNIETAKIYDGRGTYDLYQCRACKNEKITTYGVKGVTPFTIKCSCGAYMSHNKTFRSIPDYVRYERWVRPTLEQTLLFTPGTIEHILNGGLVLFSELMSVTIQTKQ